MTSALVLMVLLGLSATSEDRAVVVASTSMAHHLDGVLLAPMANTSAFTGIALSLGTAWGPVHHRGRGSS